MSAACCSLLASATALRSSFEVPQPNPDSDDEQATDPIIPPAFASDELVVINFQYSNHLCDSYQAARVKGFQNEMGKYFFMELVIHIHPMCLHQCYKPTCSTNPRGDAQPGNLLVILTDDCRELRTVANTKQQRRIADYVMYDRRNEMYSCWRDVLLLAKSKAMQVKMLRCKMWSRWLASSASASKPCLDSHYTCSTHL